ncbi:MAG: ABC transporter substrate-binding protein [Gammaproteobacteria bacterium]|nr:ABC transporter substrate-binding protein [Gammaproteobacteria bacterium]
MQARTMLSKGAGAGLVALMLMSSAAVSARDFTVVGWGGAAQDRQRAIYFEPFAKAQGISFKEDTYLGGWGQFQAMQDSGTTPWDVVQVETSEMIRGCEEGVFAALDWTKIGDKQNFLPDAVSECGVGTIVWSVLLAYNGDRLKGNEPASMADFWDTKRWPGKRGMRQGPKLNLEIALMADGVAPKEVYKVLGTPEGVDRAFAKLDQIKPLVQWWKAGAQAPEWLAAGDVDLAIAYSGRISNAQKDGINLKPIWDNTVYAIDSWVILAKSEYRDLGHAFIAFASDPARQVESAKALPYGPTRVEAADMLPPAVLAGIPAGPNLATGLFGGSAQANEFWVDNQEQLTERWNAWAAK